jgi:hypothetical protein
LAGCDTGSGGGGLSTSGKLTITGISSYNGKYAYAQGQIGEGSNMVICTKATSVANMKAVLISGDQVELPVYKFNGSNLASYSGSDTVDLMIAILSTDNILTGEGEGQPENLVAIGTASDVIFASGIGTVNNPTLSAAE